MGDTAADGSKNTESRKAWGREKRGQKVNTISNPLTHHNTPTAPKVTPGWIFNLVSISQNSPQCSRHLQVIFRLLSADLEK